MPTLRQNLSTIVECARECARAIPLARHIVMLTIIFLAVVYTSNAFILTHYYGMLAERDHDSREQKADLLAEHAGRTLYAIDLSLQTIADSLKSNLPLEKPTIFTQLLLDKYVKSLPAVRAVNVANADGLQVNSSRSFPPLPINDSDRLYFSEQKKLRGVGLYFDRIEVSRADNKPFFAVSRPILDSNGNFHGIVSAITDPTYFADFYRPRGNQASEIVMLERADGVILADTGLSDDVLMDGHPKVLNEGEKENASIRDLRGFPARIVVIDKPTITSPQFLTFCAMDIGLLLVMTVLACWLATAAAHKAAAVDREARARRSAEARLLSAIESAPAAFALYNKDDRLILSNELYGSFFAPIKDILVPGKTFKEIAEAAVDRRVYADEHQDDPEFLRWRLEQHRRGTGEPIIQLRDGRWLFMRERHTKEGDTVLFCSDITLLKNRENELKAARQLAEEANKAKTTFLANMSHELRTPLNAIIGFSEMIERKLLGPIPEGYREYGTIVRTSGQHLLSIINDILDVAKLNSGKTKLCFEPIDINQIITEAVAMISKRAEDARIRIKTDLDPRCPTIEADALRIRQVLLNVLTNAVKFTLAGGHITVSTAVVRGELRITVTDTGIGMAPEDIPRALEPFTQVAKEKSRAQEGTGLGLPISKSLVELHGGQFELTSAPKLGTTVTITLPIQHLAQHAIEKPALDIAI